MIDDDYLHLAIYTPALHQLKMPLSPCSIQAWSVSPLLASSSLVVTVSQFSEIFAYYFVLLVLYLFCASPCFFVLFLAQPIPAPLCHRAQPWPRLPLFTGDSLYI